MQLSAKEQVNTLSDPLFKSCDYELKSEYCQCYNILNVTPILDFGVFKSKSLHAMYGKTIMIQLTPTKNYGKYTLCTVHNMLLFDSDGNKLIEDIPRLIIPTSPKLRSGINFIILNINKYINYNSVMDWELVSFNKFVNIYDNLVISRENILDDKFECEQLGVDVHLTGARVSASIGKSRFYLN
jgi:hypothetical protein